MADSENVSRNTTTNDTSATATPPSFQRSEKNNPLDAYRSYTYIFTLAALKDSALTDPDSYRKSSDYYIIARSGGKGTTGIISPSNSSSEITSIDNAINDDKLVEQFNAKSPGRFDLYIDNVKIETIMPADFRTNMTVATNIEFDLFEPYSMSGFIEALQVLH